MNRIFFALAALALSFAAAAQPYPSKPVKIVAPFAPGGSADTLGRLVAQKLTEQLKENFELAKQKPLSYGSPGNGTQGQLVAELFKREAGIDLQHVPYKGASNAVADLMGGHIPVVSTTLSTAATQIKAGKAHALALS